MTQGTDIDREDLDAAAAEYVLGTLNAAERAEVEARRLRDPALDAAILAWERRLGPLVALVPDVAPPAALRQRVLSRVTATAAGAPATAPQRAVTPPVLLRPVRPARDIEMGRLEQRVRHWRTLAGAVSALAAALAGVIIVREGLREAVPPTPRTFVAVLQKDAASPAFLMTVDVAARTFTVRPVAARTPAGKSYELWLVHERLGKPKSLGVLGTRPSPPVVSLAKFDPREIEEATYAVSLEPEGGSPTDGPTGPVVYAGKLLPTGR